MYKVKITNPETGQTKVLDLPIKDRLLDEELSSIGYTDIENELILSDFINDGENMIKVKLPVLSLVYNCMLNAQIKARTRDINECYEIFNKAKMQLISKESWLRLISYDKVDFISPIAFQGMVALITGVNGEIINDIFNHKADYKIEYLHIAVFPLKESTAVILFLDDKCARYSLFEKHLTDSSLKERLVIINRIIMLYAEDYFLSKELSTDTLKSLEDTAKTLQDLVTATPKKSIKNMVKDYDLRRDMCIPNLLSEEYAVNNKGGDL